RPAVKVAKMPVGGHDPAPSQVGCTLFELLGRPEAVAELAARPQTIASAVDETLRLQPAIFFLPRTVIETIEIAGTIRVPGTLLGLRHCASQSRPPSVGPTRRFRPRPLREAGRAAAAHVRDGFPLLSRRQSGAHDPRGSGAWPGRNPLRSLRRSQRRRMANGPRAKPRVPARQTALSMRSARHRVQALRHGTALVAGWDHFRGWRAVHQQGYQEEAGVIRARPRGHAKRGLTSTSGAGESRGDTGGQA